MLRESARTQLYPLDVRSGRMVVQAWIASRGLIAAVALLLAVRQGRSLTGMVSNWDVITSPISPRGAITPTPAAS